MTPRLLVAVALLMGLTAATVWGHGTREPVSDGRLVLVSGRDDHGLVLDKQVPVYDRPGSSNVVARVPDGSLAAVTDADGAWQQIILVEGNPIVGWIDDYFLRGALHLVGQVPHCHAVLAGYDQEPGLQVVVRGLRGGSALVESVVDPGLKGWVARDELQELPPQQPDCGADPPGAKHTH